MHLTTQQRDEELRILLLMERFGGGFASKLATAWLNADGENAAKLRASFSDLLNNYRSFDK